MQNLLRPFKICRLHDFQIRSLYDHPFGFVLIFPLSGKEIFYLLFAIDDFSGIKFVGQNPTDGILAPVAVPLGF